MQARGISLTMLGVGASSTQQQIQANERAFTDIMTNISQNRENKQLSWKQSESLSLNKVDKQQMKSVGEQQMAQSIPSKASPKVEAVLISEDDIQKMVDELEALVENTFELSPEEDENVLASIMEQMMNLFLPLDRGMNLKETNLMETNSIETNFAEMNSTELILTEENYVKNPSFEGMIPTSKDLLGSDLPELKATDFTKLDKEQVKKMILEFHGIEDSSAFLTNPELMQEFASLTEGIEDVLSKLDEMFLSEENQTEENQGKRINVSEQVVSLTNDVVDEAIQNVESDKNELNTQSNPDTSISTESNNQNQANLNQRDDNQTLQSSESKTTEAEKKAQGREIVPNPVDTFVAKINEALENMLGKTEQVTHTATDIVNQVVNHIRVRVLPETTSMELSLNPQHLGKVDIVVSSTNGVAKATMTVQSEAAKEALESQLITLKETFAEKGIKVVSVEVNVSEFGFKNESDGRNEQNKTKQKGNKKIRLDRFEEEDETVIEKEAPRTVNGTIDYIA